MTMFIVQLVWILLNSTEKMIDLSTKVALKFIYKDQLWFNILYLHTCSYLLQAVFIYCIQGYFPPCHFRPYTLTNRFASFFIYQETAVFNRDNLRHWKSPSLKFAC